ncbi:MAG: NAD-dependent epimerase/dehydratase family protein [Prevotella sp.]|jgi:nucleoside-diphosphate-sugar epimerase|nr:NAD-dependent epimerase/dehydratase family protein [Prevotella sp.]
MNILITGATGFIGQNLIESIKTVHNIYIYARPSSNLDIIGLNYNVCFETDISKIRTYLIENKIEGIVHLASLFLSSHNESQIKDLIKSNIYLGASLLEASINTNVKWFLNTGTFWQHYIPDSKKYCPVNLYAATKQAFIDIARYYVETTSIRFVTLKICDTFGKNDSRPKIFNLWESNSQKGDVLDMSSGEQYIDIIHIEDVVRGFIHLIDMLNSDAILEPEYALYAKERYTLKDLCEIYEKTTGKRLNINWGARPYRIREVMNPWIAGTRLPEWMPQHDIIQGIIKSMQKE